jgi:hypothetical protein
LPLSTVRSRWGSTRTIRWRWRPAWASTRSSRSSSSRAGALLCGGAGSRLRHFDGDEPHRERRGHQSRLPHRHDRAGGGLPLSSVAVLRAARRRDPALRPRARDPLRRLHDGLALGRDRLAGPDRIGAGLGERPWDAAHLLDRQRNRPRSSYLYRRKARERPLFAAFACEFTHRCRLCSALRARMRPRLREDANGKQIANVPWRKHNACGLGCDWADLLRKVCAQVWGGTRYQAPQRRQAVERPSVSSMMEGRRRRHNR